MQYKDIKDKQFGRWTVIKRVCPRNEMSYWLCKCKCGTLKEVSMPSLVYGKSKSCGCYKREESKVIKHGQYRTGVYNTWQAMMDRCYDIKNSSYKRYGAKGIKICDKWLKFENFYKDMGDRPEGMTIHRKDNNKGYEPENCIWATRKTQTKDRDITIKIECDGEILTLIEISEKYNIPYQRVWQRYSAGHNIDEIVKSGTKKLKNVLYTFNNKSLTIQQWSFETGIKIPTLRRRLNSDKWTTEQSLTLPEHTIIDKENAGNKKFIRIKNQTMIFKDWCALKQISRSTVYKRIKEGWSIEDAIMTPQDKSKIR